MRYPRITTWPKAITTELNKWNPHYYTNKMNIEFANNQLAILNTTIVYLKRKYQERNHWDKVEPLDMPLCKAYKAEGCHDCPVCQITGFPNCQKTMRAGIQGVQDYFWHYPERGELMHKAFDTFIKNLERIREEFVEENLWLNMKI